MPRSELRLLARGGVIGRVGKNKGVVIGWIAAQRRENDLEAWLSISPNATGIGNLAEPVQPPHPVIEGQAGQLWRVNQGTAVSVYRWNSRIMQ